MVHAQGKLEHGTQQHGTIETGDVEGVCTNNWELQAKMELVTLRMKIRDTPDKHIESFEKLLETSETEMLEAYSYFFMTLPYT